MDLSFLEQLLGEPVVEEEGPRNVWTVAIVWSDKLAARDLQLVGKARELADGLGAYVNSLLLGEAATEAMAQELIACGADSIYLAPGYPTDESLARFFDERKPEFLLFTDAAGSRKIAPQVAQRLGASLVTRAVDLMLEAESRSLAVVSPLYQGAAYQVSVCHIHPHMATVQPGVFPVPYRDEWRSGTVETVDLTGEPQPPLAPVAPPECHIPLEKAEIIIAGGRGMRRAGWQLIENLAAAFARYAPQRRIAVAGSRGAMDEGWIDAERMVDLTGRTVAPDLYVACGIRGTFQHFGAMEKARCVVAINHNPQAPIFQHADYGIVGDVAEAIPALIQVLESRSRFLVPD